MAANWRGTWAVKGTVTRHSDSRTAQVEQDGRPKAETRGPGGDAIPIEIRVAGQHEDEVIEPASLRPMMGGGVGGEMDELVFRAQHVDRKSVRQHLGDGGFEELVEIRTNAEVGGEANAEFKKRRGGVSVAEMVAAQAGDIGRDGGVRLIAESGDGGVGGQEVIRVNEEIEVDVREQVRRVVVPFPERNSF